MQPLPHFAGPLLAVATLWGFGVILPGPNFLVAAQCAVSRSREEGMRAVAGIVTGTVVWTTAGYLGIHALFTAAPWLYKGFKVVGGMYLMYLGVRLLFKKQAGNSGVPVGEIEGTASAFGRGFVTTMTNPKSAIFVASVFATALPSHPPLLLGLLALTTMVTISLFWYGLMVFLFSAPAVASAYATGRRWIDRTAGAFFLLFGARLTVEP